MYLCSYNLTPTTPKLKYETDTSECILSLDSQSEIIEQNMQQAVKTTKED
jgi:hypothetical protein